MIEDEPSIVTRLPCELLVKIFKLLRPKDLTACRAVCWRWRQIIDYNIESNEKLWREHCETYYSDICHSAHVNSIPDISWYHLFKSLSLWARLAHARETRIEFLKTKLVNIVDFELHPKGTLNVLTRNSIIYYNIKTLQPYNEVFVSENCTGCSENDDFMLLLNEKLELRIIRKDTTDIIGDFKLVYAFLTISDSVYYVTPRNDLFKCTLVDGRYTSSLLTQFSGTVLSLGHKNGILYTLVAGDDCCNVFSFINDVQVPVLLEVSCRDVFQALRQYDFINHTEWEIFFNKLRDIFSKDIEQLCFNDLQILHMHGPVLIAGYSPGILRIFYSLYTTDVVDLLSSRPLKVYHLCKPHEAIFNCIYLKIAVVEGGHSHTVLVAMLKKITAIKFTYPLSSDEIETCPGCNKNSTVCEMQSNCYRLQSCSWGEKIINWSLLMNNWEPSISTWQPFASYEESYNDTEEPSTSSVEPATNNEQLGTSSNKKPSFSSGESSSGEESPSVEKSSSGEESSIGEESFSDKESSSGEESSNSGQPLHKVKKISL